MPELVNHDELVKANSWIEGSTILAILLGMTIGAKVADASIHGALIGAISLFLFSAAIANFLNSKAKNITAPHGFFVQMPTFFCSARARFVILGGALFWASAATLRVILVAWSPLVLDLHSATDIAQLTLFLAIGIVVGSAIVPRLIPLEHLRRTRFAAYGMAILIITLSFTNTIWMARSVLFFIGTMGGMFIVPINAALQELGNKTIGSGQAIALQGFFQNLAMLSAVGSYSFAASQNVNPTFAMLSLGSLFLISAVIVAFFLRRVRD